MATKRAAPAKASAKARSARKPRRLPSKPKAAKPPRAKARPRKPQAPKPEALPTGGRPTSYRPEFATQAEIACRLGATDVDLADLFGVSIRTIANWRVEHPEFLHALKAGKGEVDELVERTLLQRALGYTFDAVKIFLPKDSREPVIVPFREHCPPDVTAIIFWLKNRRRAQWRDVHKHEHTGDDGGPIKTEELSDTDVARRIALILSRAAQKS